MMKTTIYFDMDGTIADLYGYENWLDSLIAEQTKPYRMAKSMVDMRKLGKTLNTLKALGYEVGIVSWLSKNGSDEYNARVAETKKNWLASHLGSVEFDEIHIVKYGTPKQTVVNNPFGILFDDEQPNRDNWTGPAYGVENILQMLSSLFEQDRKEISKKVLTILKSYGLINYHLN